MLSHIKGSTCQESWPNILNAVNAGGGKLQDYSSEDTFHFHCAAMERCTKLPQRLLYG